jgi:DNA-directed RNA polymerase subunit M/transcription elongation factor TFIIS
MTDRERTNKYCPKCNNLLYPINSQSDLHECLQKDCGYSEVKKVSMYNIASLDDLFRAWP